MKKAIFMPIELLIVIAVIAILAAMLRPTLNRAWKTTHNSIFMNSMRQA